MNVILLKIRKILKTFKILKVKQGRLNTEIKSLDKEGSTFLFSRVVLLVIICRH